MHADHRSTPDQAELLRRLVENRTAPSDSRASHRRGPRIVAVAGGKGGVGTTTLAVNLAVHWAQQGLRTVLADFDIAAADVATLCRVEAGGSLVDVVRRRLPLAEALCPGPKGLRILSGPSATEPDASPLSAVTARQLLAALCDPGLAIERIVIDAGNAAVGQPWRWFGHTDQVLLVTTTEPVSLMDSYGAVKRLATEGSTGYALSYAINFVAHAHDADDVHARFARSCWRFLSLDVPLAGTIPVDPAVVAAARARVPLLLQSPGSRAARAVARLSQHFRFAGRTADASASVSAAASASVA